MALILAAIVFIATVALSAVIVFADGMSDSPGTSISPWPTLIGGSLIAVGLAASHWLPHIGW